MNAGTIIAVVGFTAAFCALAVAIILGIGTEISGCPVCTSKLSIALIAYGCASAGTLCGLVCAALFAAGE